MKIEVGALPVAIVVGDNAVNIPVVEFILYIDIVSLLLLAA